MIKKLPVKILAIIMTLTVIMSPFFVSVKAADATLDDVLGQIQNFEALYKQYTQKSGSVSWDQSIDNFLQTTQYNLLLDFQNKFTDLYNIISVGIPSGELNPDGTPVITSAGVLDRLAWINNNLNSISSSASSSASSLSSILSALQTANNALNNINTFLNNFNSLDIPIESLNAYVLFTKLNNSSVNIDSNLKYPIVHVTQSIDNAYMNVRKLQIPANNTVVLAFMLYNAYNLNSSTMPFYTYYGLDNEITVTYKLHSIGVNRRLYHVIIHNNTNNVVDASFDFRYNVDIVPYYFGLESLMSEQMASAIMYYERESNNDLLFDIRSSLYDSSDNVSWLQKIYNQIVGNTDPDNKYQDNKEDLNQSIDDYIAVESTFNTDFSNNMVDVKTEINNTSSMLESLSLASNFISGIIQRFYSVGASQGISIIFLLPLILGIALFFIGRGGIALRQGPATDEYMTIDEEPTIVNGTKYQMHRVYHRSRHHNKKG